MRANFYYYTFYQNSGLVWIIVKVCHRTHVYRVSTNWFFHTCFKEIDYINNCIINNDLISQECCYIYFLVTLCLCRTVSNVLVLASDSQTLSIICICSGLFRIRWDYSKDDDILNHYQETIIFAQLLPTILNLFATSLT